MPARRREPLARELPAELQVAATNDSILTDSRGRKYIDFVIGWCVGNFGWRPAAIARAIERFRGADYVYPVYSYAPWTELARQGLRSGSMWRRGLRGRPPRPVPPQRAARVDRRIDGAA